MVYILLDSIYRIRKRYADVVVAAVFILFILVFVLFCLLPFVSIYKNWTERMSEKTKHQKRTLNKYQAVKRQQNSKTKKH